jgi:hypothetical protein
LGIAVGRAELVFSIPLSAFNELGRTMLELVVLCVVVLALTVAVFVVLLWLLVPEVQKPVGVRGKKF